MDMDYAVIWQTEIKFSENQSAENELTSNDLEPKLNFKVRIIQTFIGST